MGHDIYGFDKAKTKVAYARFNMWNGNAAILYQLLDCEEYNGGVSGIGMTSILARPQLDQAMYDFYHFSEKDSHHTFSEGEFLDYDEKQIKEFLVNCLAVAKREGSVEVYFG